MKNRLDFGVNVFGLDSFNINYLRGFIRGIYKLDKCHNPWYCDFYLDKTYYIHLISGDQKVFCVVPFKLSSDFSINSNLVINCFSILEKGLQEFLSKNIGYNVDIIIYVSKYIVERIDQDILIKNFEEFNKDFDKLIKDTSSLKGSGIVEIISEDVLIKRLKDLNYYFYGENISYLNNLDFDISSKIDKAEVLSDDGEIIVYKYYDEDQDEVDIFKNPCSNYLFKRLDFSCTIYDLNNYSIFNMANNSDYKDDYIFNDVITFSNWIKHLYSNKILYNFHFDKTYYVQLIDGYGKTFSVVSLRLVSLEDEDKSIINCFNKLKMSGENYSKNEIFVYIGKEILSSIVLEDIIQEFRNAQNESKKIITCLKMDGYFKY